MYNGLSQVYYIKPEEIHKITKGYHFYEMAAQ